MSSREGTPLVFACDLGALTPEQRARQAELRARLERSTTRVKEDPEGYTFEYATDLAPTTVAEWVDLERKCCPFLRFTVDVPEQSGPVQLHVRGAAGVKTFLAAEMRIQSGPPESVGG